MSSRLKSYPNFISQDDNRTLLLPKAHRIIFRTLTAITKAHIKAKTEAASFDLIFRFLSPSGHSLQGPIKFCVFQPGCFALAFASFG